MKKLILFLAILLSSCSGFNQLNEDVTAFQAAIDAAVTSEEEESAIQEILDYPSLNEGVSIQVQVIDAEGKKVMNDPSKAIAPVRVTIIMAKSLVAAEIEFYTENVENLYLLLNE